MLNGFVNLLTILTLLTVLIYQLLTHIKEWVELQLSANIFRILPYGINDLDQMMKTINKIFIKLPVNCLQ